jgi:protein-S-isoprenylcysteine O-methyltransferase Ste14
MTRNFLFLIVITIFDFNLSFKCSPILIPPFHSKRIFSLTSKQILQIPSMRSVRKESQTLRAIIDTNAVDVPSEPESGKKKNNIQQTLNETKDYLLKFREAEFRQQFLDDLKSIFSSAYNNIREGDVGKRGEELFFAQLSLVSLVVFGVPTILVIAIRLLGFISTASGLYFIARGIWALKDNLSPFITPISSNQLVTTGIFNAVRHPLYTGLIALCLGISISSNSVDKTVLTIILAYFLDKKADKEEEYLDTVHPLTYEVYKTQTKKLIPSIY